MQPESSQLKDLVLAPGPVQLHPKVLEALALPMIHHRTPLFDQILKKVLQDLKIIFQTTQDCFIQTSTGSGGMEALLVNTLASGDKVIGIDSGKFGERWCEMAKVYGAKLITHKVIWGQAVHVEKLRQLLNQHPDCKILLCQACETSTGVSHPIEQIGSMLKKEFPEVLFLVDGITALGAFPLKMDDWNIDGLVGGSQKAFMLPTGLSFLSFSQKAWRKIESNPQARFYFDIRKEKKANQAGETFFSANVTLIRALAVVLDMIKAQGFEKFLATIAARAARCREMGTRLGLGLYAENPSDSVTAFLVPTGVDGQKLRARLEEKHKITIMGGQDQAKGKIIRIGHMGYILPEDEARLEMALKQTLAELQT